MKNDEVYEQAFLRHSTFLVHYSIFLFGSSLSGPGLSCLKEPPWLEIAQGFQFIFLVLIRRLPFIFSDFIYFE
jgi:hypothetical protein